MPFCGFDKQMLEGMQGFHTGLIEHGIIARSKMKNQTNEETIKKEINDMKRFQEEIHNIKDPLIQELIMKLTEYAEAFYKLLEVKGVENYPELIEKINHLYFEMDRKYYDELEGKENDMKLLVEHMDKIGGKI